MWKEISPSSSTLDIKKSPGEAHAGKYIGKQEIQTKIGPQVVWKFDAEEGNFGIYGFTNLNRIMEGVSEGTDLRITYLGTKNIATKYGVKPVHQVKVEAWGEDLPEETKNVADKFGMKPVSGAYTDKDNPFL
jgi:hypothetical protein